jgi:CHAT domain-containing protein/tetratricopeptide (TPR) repeat protein
MTLPALAYTVQSQTSDQLYLMFMETFQQQQFQRASETGKKYLEQTAVQDTNYLKVLRYQAFCYYQQTDYASAVSHYEKARDLAALLTGKENYDYIMITYNLAVNNAYTGNYSQCFELMDEVLGFIERDQTRNSMDYINTSVQLANIYTMSGNTEKAGEKYEEIFDVVKQNFSETDTVYMQYVNTISTFYLQNGLYEKAEPFFLNSVKMMGQYYGTLSENYILTLNSLGELYLYAGLYGKMEEVYREFVDLCLKFYGKNSADYATSLNNLAVSFEKQGKNREAEELYLQCLKIKEKVYKKESDFYALSLSNLAVLYDNMGRYAESEKLYNQAIAIYRKVYGESHDNYAIAVSNMASVLSALGKYEKALGMLDDVARIQKEKYGEKYTGYITTLNNMASIYEDAGNYGESEKLYEKTAALLKEVVGESHTNYAIALAGLAHVKILRTRYSEAEALLLKVLEIQRTAVGENHPSYINVLNQLAGLYSFMGNYVLSEDYYLQCMQKYRTVYGDLHPEYSVFLNNLGTFYLESGRYEEAERAIRQSLAIHDFSLGPDHPDRMNMLAGLSNIMLRTGNLRQAEAYALESVKLTREKLGVEHPSHLSALLYLGVFYFQSGNYAKAEKIYSEVLEKQRKVTGENSSEYITALNNTGALYLTLCQNSADENEASVWAMRADSCFRKVLEKDSLLLGTNHPDFALHLNNLAELYSSTGQYRKSEEYHLKSIEKTINIFGENYPELAVSWHNLAILYTRTGNYEKAMEYAIKSLAMKQQMYGAGSSAGSDVMPSIAYIFEKQGNSGQAREWYSKAMATQYDLLKKNFAFLSEEEKASYYATLTHYSDMFAAFAIGDNSPESSALLYNTMLINKGILLRSSGKMKKAVTDSRDRNLLNTYNEWLGYRQELAKLYSMPADKRYRNAEELEEKANEVEKVLVSAVPSEKADDIFSIDWTIVRNALADNEAAVEFGHYKKLEENNTYSDNYFACVVRKTDASPVLVPLFTAEEMEKLLSRYSGTTAKYISGLYAGNDLYQMIWQPIEQHLSGVTSVYYSPDGLLHKVAFSSLRKTAEQYVSDHFNLVMLSSTRMLADKKGTFAPGSISVFGGALFSEDKQEAGGWPYLEGTLTEAGQLKKIFSEAKQQVTLYTGALASEENVKALTGKQSPRILHIATHGYFYSPQEKNTMVQEEQSLVADVMFRGGTRDMLVFQNSPNPLMRSGLILAGANRIWEENDITGDDGILTAYEVSNLNLSNTQLVVLSACETGLGDIKGSEGVYGLQRAFKMAGAKYMIMSLWQVPDKETVEFMDSFYKKLIAGRDIRKAFAETQNEMRKKYDPYYWGAFVLVE